MEEGKIIAYKGMDNDMKCRGFQYEVGGEYEEEKAELCKIGFHACEYPLNLFDYYPPNSSRYFQVEQSGEIKSDGDKTVSNKIKIGAEIGIPELVKAAIEYTVERSHPEEEPSATGCQGAASATGDRGAASATGYRGAASATGCQGASSATGDRGAASATGYQGAASATGDRGAASATGYRGAASATGCQGASSATGDRGAASATGYQGAASATGYQGAASATGCQGAASATGCQGAASATGDQGAASATGCQGAASATGKASVALATGIDGMAKGSIGSAICIVERGELDGETYPIVAIKAAIIDGKKLKADTYYTLKGGKFVAVEE